MDQPPEYRISNVAKHDADSARMCKHATGRGTPIGSLRNCSSPRFEEVLGDIGGIA